MSAIDKQLIAQLLGLAIRGTVAGLGVAAADKLLDETRKAMVRENRGPTDAEIDALMGRIQARSDRIQGA